MLAAMQVATASCVRVRNGGDSIDCMKFHAAERRSAARFGLSLGEPYAMSHRKLLRRGWVLDRSRKDEGIEPRQIDAEGLVCGVGWDALCSAVFRRSGHAIVLVLASGSNSGLPLISVEPQR
jgi:hypothetical protein